MQTPQLHKRTFKALNYPKGSTERAELNRDTATSEYMKSYKWNVNGENFCRTFKTKKEAVRFLLNYIADKRKNLY